MRPNSNTHQTTYEHDCVTVSFFHSTPLRRGENGNFYAVALNASVWDRYLRHFDRVVVSMPTERGQIEGRHRVNAPAVDFMPMSPRGGLGRRLVGRFYRRRQIRDSVFKSEAVVARLPSSIGAAACREARRQNKPYAVEVVGCAWSCYWYHSLAGKVLAPLNLVITRAAVRRATSVLYVTDEYLQRRYPTPAPWWAASNAQVYPPSEDDLRARIRQLRDAGTRPLRLATVGALDVKYKGQETGIRALAELRSRGVDAEYHLIGGGSRDRLSRLAAELGVADSVIFHGVVPNPQVVETLRSTDIYLHPSFTEGQPRAVVEAMSVATPVVGAAAGGTPENLPDEQTFPPGDVNALVDRIQTLLQGGLGPAAEWSAKRAQHFAPSRLAAQRDGFLFHLRQSIARAPSPPSGPTR